MIRNVKGDLLATDADVICHQVNCRGVMGAGLARQIRTRFPSAYTMYVCHCKGRRPQDLLGTYLAVNRYGDGWENRLPFNSQPLIVHAFGQLNYGRGGTYTSYHALESIFTKLRDDMRDTGRKTLAIPKYIGCGLAGGDWAIVEALLDEIFLDDPNITLVIVEYAK